jgi:hypothetical protein
MILIKQPITILKIVKITASALLFGITACALCAVGIAALASFPQVAQALPKDCGKTFTLDGETHCVKVQTASDEGAVLDVVSPLPEGVKGLEYCH